MHSKPKNVSLSFLPLSVGTNLTDEGASLRPELQFPNMIDCLWCAGPNWQKRDSSGSSNQPSSQPIRRSNSPREDFSLLLTLTGEFGNEKAQGDIYGEERWQVQVIYKENSMKNWMMIRMPEVGWWRRSNANWRGDHQILNIHLELLKIILYKRCWS